MTLKTKNRLPQKKLKKKTGRQGDFFCISKFKSLVQQWNRRILTLFLFPRQNVKNIFFHVPVWFNSNIWNNNNSVFYKQWYRNSVLKNVGDFLSNNGNFLSKNVFSQFKFHILKRKCAMQYNSIIIAISSFWNVYVESRCGPCLSFILKIFH